MFILILSFPLFILSFLWHLFDIKSRAILRCFIFFGGVFCFSFFYFNGNDWSIYYLKFFNGESVESFEPGFVLLFNLLLYITSDNFGFAILLFYVLAFYFLLRTLKNNTVNEPLFFLVLLFMLGNTLILEQLRQFLACIIILYAMIEYSTNKKNIKPFLLICFAALFHVSALIMIPALILTKIKSRIFFVCVTLFSITSFVLILFLAEKVVLNFLGDNFIVAKASYYFHANPIEFKMGWLNLLMLPFVFWYSVYGSIVDDKSLFSFLSRLIFIGSVIFLFSGMITFLLRVFFYFVFVAAYLFSFMPSQHYKRFLSISTYNTLVLNFYFAIILILFNASYYRNSNAPVQFNNTKMYLFELFDKNYVHNLADSKYLNTPVMGK